MTATALTTAGGAVFLRIAGLTIDVRPLPRRRRRTAGAESAAPESVIAGLGSAAMALFVLFRELRIGSPHLALGPVDPLHAKRGEDAEHYEDHQCFEHQSPPSGLPLSQPSATQIIDVSR